MWTRSELKQSSKQFLKKFFVKAVIACLIFSIVDAIFDSHGSGSSNSSDRNTHKNKTTIEYDSQQSKTAINDSIVIGDDAIVESGANIGDGVVIGDSAIIESGANIGNNAVIGDSAVVESGAIVGKNAVIGDSAIIESGGVVEDNAIVGDSVIVESANTFKTGSATNNTSNIKKIGTEQRNELLKGIFLNKNSYFDKAIDGITVFGGGIFKSLKPIQQIILGISTGIFMVLLLIFILLGKILLLNPMHVGLKRFFLSGYRKKDAKLEDMFSTFTDGHWFGYSVKILYLDIIILLWTLLFIIPGIYKYYQYYYVPYILSDNPEISVKDAMAISKEMTEGKKIQILELNLSFIPWTIVSILLFGLGFLVLHPYIEGTDAALYLYEKDEPIQLYLEYWKTTL